MSLIFLKDKSELSNRYEKFLLERNFNYQVFKKKDAKEIELGRRKEDLNSLVSGGNIPLIFSPSEDKFYFGEKGLMQFKRENFRWVVGFSNNL